MITGEYFFYFVVYFLALGAFAYFIRYKQKNRRIFVDADVMEQVQTKGDMPINNSEGMFQHPFSFKGRIRRREYALSCIIYILFEAPTIEILTKDTAGLVNIFLLFSIPFSWFIIAQSTKRLHDMGYSGWFQLGVYLPFVIHPLGILLSSTFMILFDGEKKINKYGSYPKHDYYEQLISKNDGHKINIALKSGNALLNICIALLLVILSLGMAVELIQYRKKSFQEARERYLNGELGSMNRSSMFFVEEWRDKIA